MDPWVEKQDKRDRKKHKRDNEMLYFVCDAEQGIPLACTCGAGITNEVSTNPADKDWTPGRRFFTCKKYKNDGLHFRQPWVVGVQEEISRLREKVDEMAAQIDGLKEIVTRIP